MRQLYIQRRHTQSTVDSRRLLPRPVLLSSLRVERDVLEDKYLVLRPVGDLESANISIFRQAVADVGLGERVIIDMAGVPFLDSCGIGALIGAVRRIRERGGDMTLAAVRRPVDHVLHLSGFDRIVEILATVEEAASFLDRPPASSVVVESSLARNHDATRQTYPVRAAT